MDAVIFMIACRIKFSVESIKAEATEVIGGQKFSFNSE